MMNSSNLVKVICDRLPGAEVPVINDLTGTQDHWKVTIVAPQFEGKMMLAQHRLVYAALDDHMEAKGGPIHALSLETYTPEQWKQKNNS